MNLKSLEYFLEVAKDLNMTSAAQRLYISQQALSLQIQKLEQHYGVTLFERQPKLQLTYAGLQLVESAKVMLQENEALINTFSEISSKQTGLLRIGIQAFRAAQCLPAVMPGFNQRWPNVSLHLVEGSTEEMLPMLCDGALDLHIGTPSRSEMQSLGDRVEFTFLLDDRSYIVCSDVLLERCFGDLAAEIKEQSSIGTDLREFSQMPFFLHKLPMRLRKVADECFQNAGFKPKVFMESSNTELMISLYSCHLGAFFCRRTRLPALMNTLEGFNAFPIKYNNIPHQTPVYLMRRKYKRPPAHVIDFIQLMQGAWNKIAEF